MAERHRILEPRLERGFPADAQAATITRFYLTGIAMGLLAPDSAKDWAFGVIEAFDAPPVEIIEVATANDRNSAMQALAAVTGDADEQLAGRWLLGCVHDQLASGHIRPLDAARSAMGIVQSSNLPRDAWIEFMHLDDDLQLAADGLFGSSEEIGLDLLSALSQHSSSAR